MIFFRNWNSAGFNKSGEQLLGEFVVTNGACLRPALSLVAEVVKIHFKRKQNKRKDERNRTNWNRN